MTSETQTQARNESAERLRDWFLRRDQPDHHGNGLLDAALREQARITPIDEEVLAQAMARMRWAWLAWTDRPLDGDVDRRTEAFRNAADRLAAEYARLAALPHDSTPGEPDIDISTDTVDLDTPITPGTFGGWEDDSTPGELEEKAR